MKDLTALYVRRWNTIGFCLCLTVLMAACTQKPGGAKPSPNTKIQSPPFEANFTAMVLDNKTNQFFLSNQLTNHIQVFHAGTDGRNGNFEPEARYKIAEPVVALEFDETRSWLHVATKNKILIFDTADKSNTSPKFTLPATTPEEEITSLAYFEKSKNLFIGIKKTEYSGKIKVIQLPFDQNDPALFPSGLLKEDHGYIVGQYETAAAEGNDKVYTAAVKAVRRSVYQWPVAADINLAESSVPLNLSYLFGESHAPPGRIISHPDGKTIYVVTEEGDKGYDGRVPVCTLETNLSCTAEPIILPFQATAGFMRNDPDGTPYLYLAHSREIINPTRGNDNHPFDIHRFEAKNTISTPRLIGIDGIDQQARIIQLIVSPSSKQGFALIDAGTNNDQLVVF